MLALAFTCYCLVKQYLWTRQNRYINAANPRSERSSQNVSSPNESTPFTKCFGSRNKPPRSLSLSDGGEVEFSNILAAASNSPNQNFSTFVNQTFSLVDLGTPNMQRVTNAAVSLSPPTSPLLSIDPILLIEALPPFQSEIVPRSGDEYEAGLFLQRLQIVRHCQQLLELEAINNLRSLNEQLLVAVDNPNSIKSNSSIKL